MHREREKDNFKSREIKRLKECTLALSKSLTTLTIKKAYGANLYQFFFERKNANFPKGHSLKET